jgi:putative DNA primase/helicase
MGRPRKEVATATADEIVLNKQTPLLSAQVFRRREQPTLINYQDEWLSWNGSAYEVIEARTMRALVHDLLGRAKTVTFESIVDAQTGKRKHVEGRAPFNPKKGDVDQVLDALESICHVPNGEMDPPSWKGTPAKLAALDPRNIISFKNGLLDITTRTLYPPSDRFFTRNALAIEYSPIAPAPLQWLAFLDDVLQGRGSSIDLLQEIIGYLITPDTSKQKVFMLWGRPRCGKGTILRITTALVGPRNVRFPTIKLLGGRFGLVGLIGASVAQVTDMDVRNENELSTALTNINGISGEDGQQIERKGISDWCGVLGARFVLSSNTLPKAGSQTEAFLARLLVVPFEVTVMGREDRGLTAKLMTELPGILNWALDGLDRLRARGDFDEPPESKSAKRRVRFLSNPLHGFVEEHCVLVGPNAGTDKDVLYEAFDRYCTSINAKPWTKAVFTEEIQKVFPGVREGRRRRTPTAARPTPREPCYFGIELNEATALRVYEIEPEDIGLGVLFKRDRGWPIPRRYVSTDDFGV